MNTNTFAIQRIFLKNVSLEIPAGAKLFLETTPLSMNLHLDVNVLLLTNNIFEVAIKATLKGEKDNTVKYLLEVDQAGIFQVEADSATSMDATLRINGPMILAPYLRSVISETLSRATLPQFLLPEINWAAVYEQNKKTDELAEVKGPVLH